MGNEPASCCFLSPGGLRPFRILCIDIGLDRSAESATEFLSSCPPPSRILPSIRILAMDAMAVMSKRRKCEST